MTSQTLKQEVTVDLSITGKRWSRRSDNDEAVFELSNKTGLPESVAHILVGRGMTDAESAISFLDVNLSDLEDPSHLLDMDKAVERLELALKEGHTIAVFGDYDVDGGCASAILLRYLRAIGAKTLLYIPDRMTEGYGPNPEAMDKLKEMGADVVITVDCGSVAFEPMARAAEIGLDVIITDHHQTKPEKPACVAFINPNRVDETSPCTMLSGAGVAFYLVLALNRSLRSGGFFKENGLKEPDSRELLDLVAVSSVCDMVPLTGVNRILTKRGLQMMASYKNEGLKALAEVCSITEMPNTYHAGFLIGPRINAGGRIDSCDLGARCLSTTDENEAQALAVKLDGLNVERKEIETQVQELALARMEQVFREGDNALVVDGTGWHPGVVGIVAARLKEKVHRPTFVISVEDGVGKGSGRSISGIDLGKALRDSEDLLQKGGGHAMAAGLTMDADKIHEFRKRFNELVGEQAAKAGHDVFTPVSKFDGVLSLASLTSDFLGQLDKLAPYGMGNPEPKFVFNGVQVVRSKAVGKDGSHVQVWLSDRSGKTVSGIAFRAMTSDLGPFLMSRQPMGVSILGTIKKDTWQGKEQIKIHVDDARPGSFIG